MSKAFALVVVLAVSAWGQVRIQSRHGMNVPEEKVSLLFNVTCRVVAEEFRLSDASEVQVPVTLVVGESRDGVVGDETNQVFTIYMPRWDEAMFATSVSRIALQHLLSRDRKARIVSESLRRANRVAPISVDALTTVSRHHPPSPSPGSAPPSPRASISPAVPCSSSPASPLPAEGEDRQRSHAFCPPGAQFAP